MASTSTVGPNLGIPANWTQGEPNWNDTPGGGTDYTFGLLDAIVMAQVLSMTVAAPPASPSNGDRYIIPPGATGAWATHANALTVWRDGAWRYYPPSDGWRAKLLGAGYLGFDGTSWFAEPHFMRLGDIGDVAIGTAAFGQALIFNGTKWANGTVASGAGSLSALSDVTLGTLAGGQVLQFNGTKWVNGSVSAAVPVLLTRTSPGVLNLGSLGGLASSYNVSTSASIGTVASGVVALDTVLVHTERPEIWYSAKPTPPYTRSFLFRPLALGFNNQGAAAGFAFFDSSSHKFCMLGARYDGNQWYWKVMQWTGPSTFNTYLFQAGPPFGLQGASYGRMTDDGTNLIFQISPSGNTWLTAVTSSIAGSIFGGGGYDSFGFMIDPLENVLAVEVLDFF